MPTESQHQTLITTHLTLTESQRRRYYRKAIALSEEIGRRVSLAEVIRLVLDGLMPPITEENG